MEYFIFPGFQRNNMKLYFSPLLLILYGHSHLSYADEHITHESTAMKDHQQITVEGGVTVTLQNTDASGVDNELLGSFDLVSILPARKGEVVVYVEGNSTPLSNGVASHFEEANGDAGSALDRDGKGRFQVSEFFYAHHFGESGLAVGLLNPAASLDTSEVANDETTQFLGTSFVNNPTIGMPDYTLGTVFNYEGMQREIGNGLGFTLMVTSSHGLADNPNASYSELVDVTADGKGAFVAMEADGQIGIVTWRLGVWSNSADHDYVDGSGKTGSNKGGYLSADLDFDVFIQHSKLNLRIGMADEKVSNAGEFYGVSLETPLVDHILGLGLANTGASSEAGSNAEDLHQAEVYVRFNLSDTFHITPSIQWLENSGLREDPDEKSVIITSLRASYGF